MNTISLESTFKQDLSNLKYNINFGEQSLKGLDKSKLKELYELLQMELEF